MEAYSSLNDHIQSLRIIDTCRVNRRAGPIPKRYLKNQPNTTPGTSTILSALTLRTRHSTHPQAQMEKAVTEKNQLRNIHCVENNRPISVVAKNGAGGITIY